MWYLQRISISRFTFKKIEFPLSKMCLGEDGQQKAERVANLKIYE